MSQSDLFEAGARLSDPETSKAAAAAQEPRLRASQALVLQVFRAYGRMHDKDLLDRVHATQRGLGLAKLMSPSGVRTRRSELVKLGKLCDTGHTAMVDGHSMTIWGLA